MKDSRLLVKGCPLCSIFTEKNIYTKLYWPNNIEEVPESEFVILDCDTCKIPMVVYGDHVMSLTKESWGRILYRCRKLFGSGITLRKSQRKILDHLHFHVYNIDKK